MKSAAGLLRYHQLDAHRQHLRIPTGVIPVLVRINDIADRLIGERLYLGQNAVVIPIVLVIDQNHTIPRDRDRDISASATHLWYRRDLIEILPDLVQLQISMNRLLGARDPDAAQQNHAQAKS